MAYLLLKTLHVLSATILFGTGLGTAFHMWATDRRGDVRAVAVTARNVVLADWLFTTPAAVVQPLTGVALAHLAGYGLLEPWLIAAYGLYALAGGCWLPVLALQIRMARAASTCAAAGTPLDAEYRRAMGLWVRLGWPAFLAFVGIFWLMVAKPALW